MHPQTKQLINYCFMGATLALAIATLVVTVQDVKIVDYPTYISSLMYTTVAMPCCQIISVIVYVVSKDVRKGIARWFAIAFPGKFAVASGCFASIVWWHCAWDDDIWIVAGCPEDEHGFGSREFYTSLSVVLVSSLHLGFEAIIDHQEAKKRRRQNQVQMTQVNQAFQPVVYPNTNVVTPYTVDTPPSYATAVSNQHNTSVQK